MREEILEVIREVGPKVGQALMEKLNLDEGIAASALEKTLPSIIKQVKTIDKSKFLPLIGKFTSGAKIDDLSEIADMPVVQEIISHSNNIVGEQLKLDESNSNKATAIILPMVAEFLKQKYGSNPMSLLSLMGGENPVGNIASQLGGFFGGNK